MVEQCAAVQPGTMERCVMPAGHVGQHWTRPAAPSSPRVPTERRQMAGLGIVGGALMAVGSLMPWASVRSGFGSIDAVGTDGDGVVTLGIGVVVALIGAYAWNGRSLGLAGVVMLALALLAGWVGVIDFQGGSRRIDANDSEFVRASVGAGLYVVIAGAAIAALAGLNLVRRRRDAG